MLHTKSDFRGGGGGRRSRFGRVIVMRHLEPGALVTAFYVEAFVCFAAVED